MGMDMKTRSTDTIRLLLLITLFVPMVALGQVRSDQLETRDGLLYRVGEDTPYTGDVQDTGELAGRVEDGKRMGEWTTYFPNGQRGMVEVYEAGIRTERISWYENGAMSSRTYFDAEGGITGLMQHWDRQGNLREAHEWENGVEHGDAKLYDHNGALLRSATFVDGEPHGAVTWWYPDGSKRWETHFDRGIRTGTWTQYDREGGAFMTSTWSDGKLVSRRGMHDDH